MSPPLSNYRGGIAVSQTAETRNHRAPREPLFGRERELRALRELPDGIQERGAAVVVRGEAGIGKSVLIETASDEARARGFQLLITAGVRPKHIFPLRACISFVPVPRPDQLTRRRRARPLDRV